MSVLNTRSATFFEPTSTPCQLCLSELRRPGPHFKEELLFGFPGFFSGPSAGPSGPWPWAGSSVVVCARPLKLREVASEA